MGMLAANHFMTVTEGTEDLRRLGELVLWEGAKDVRFEVADEEMIRKFRQERKAKL
ncbi:hypothetical protein ONS96_008803 [Cadophora gregata f. sp. sojae]|nr:hypothetical protein ONS96_008803 [Cadophora gregata f. sp. sojae]